MEVEFHVYDFMKIARVVVSHFFSLFFHLDPWGSDPIYSYFSDGVKFNLHLDWILNHSKVWISG